MNDCPPRYATPRTPERQTLGAAATKIAAELGTPLMPWQQQVLDTALEIDPETGRLAYREVILTVPRQSGKTTLLLVLVLLWALRRPHAQIRFTAQTGADARKKVLDDWVPLLEPTRFSSLYHLRLTNGHEALRFLNGSHFGLVATTKKSGHGASLDLVILDEAFAHSDSRLEQSLKPTQITRPEPQMWIVSTAGVEAESPFLYEKVVAGRGAAEAGLRHSVAYFEWAPPAGSDPGDPATWRATMPALGTTVTEAAVRSDFQTMDLSEFRRAYLNEWVKASVQSVIPAATWNALSDPHSSALDPVALAIDVTPDRSSSAIAAAAKRSDGRWHVEVIERHPGTAWVVDRVAELDTRHRPCVVAIDAASPAASLLAELERSRVPVVTAGSSDMARACGLIYDAAIAGNLRHLGDPALNAALDGAVRRQIGDAWAWSRRSSAIDISPLVAVTLALWGAETHAGVAESQYAHVWFGSDLPPEPPAPSGSARGPKIVFRDEEETRRVRFRSIYEATGAPDP